MNPPDLRPSFDDAFRRCFPRAFAVATRIVGDAATAEEIAAEAMTRAFVRWRKVSRYDSVEAWVVRVAANLAIDAVRRRRRFDPTANDNATTAGRGTGDATDRVASNLVLAAALRTLPTRQREAVFLCHFEGFTPHEVAEVLDVSANTVRTHVRRGVEALRHALRDKELPSWTT